MILDLRALPVFMYHSIAPAGAMSPHGWLQRLSVPLETFEATLADWTKRGIRTIGTREMGGFLAGTMRLPRGSVALTLDDGYLDNWVAVFPLLKRYGHRAIIFVSTDFIDPRPIRRPTIEDAPEPSAWQGYLSVPEMQAMVESGLVEIQSHARTHTWEFVSPNLVDFYGPHWNIEHPKCRYRFLWLNRHPSLKPFALEHLRREAIPWGTPVYEFAPALVARRYLPDPEIEARLVDLVARKGGESFFDVPDWRQALDREVEEHRSRFGDRGSYETDLERERRLRDELEGSRRTLEQLTGRDVRFLSPPQGGADGDTLALAKAVGYELVTAPSIGRIRLNRRGRGLGWVHRCGTGYDLFGQQSGRSASILSQRIVAARCAGTPGASLITRGIAVARRLVSLRHS